jgi:hypothetical protein
MSFTDRLIVHPRNRIILSAPNLENQKCFRNRDLVMPPGAKCSGIQAMFLGMALTFKPGLQGASVTPKTKNKQPCKIQETGTSEWQ